MEPGNIDLQTIRIYSNLSQRHYLLIKFYQIRHNIHSLSGQYPPIFIPLSRIMIRLGMLRGEAVSKGTDLVIEGYPRSGNTFAVHAFRTSQLHRTIVAHHLHSPAQVVWAARKDIPTLVLVRKPEDAVLSNVIRLPHRPIKQCLKDYIRFYTSIKPYQDKYVVATLDEITTDFGETINKINQRFGTKFAPFVHNDENVNQIFRLIEQTDLEETGRGEVSEARVARPSSERERIKTVLQRKFESEDLRDLITRAQALYRDFLSYPNQNSIP